MNQSLTPTLLLSACLVSFLPVQATAGEQLTLDTLIQSADAVVLVDNPLSHPAKVTRVLLGDEALQEMSIQPSLCVPSAEIIARWLQTHPQHPSRQVWQEVLDDGGMEQVVFLRSINDRVEPYCETEVMLGLSFSKHVAYAAYRKEVDKLIGERKMLAERAAESVDQSSQ